MRKAAILSLLVACTSPPAATRTPDDSVAVQVVSPSTSSSASELPKVEAAPSGSATPGEPNNYVSSVRPGNQTALNTARVPFAAYIVAMHRRIHPIFDAFLQSLGQLPSGHPMNDGKVFTSLEIVLERQQGRVVRMGVTRTSGLPAFDIAALDTVNQAQPFGTPADAMVSSDGNVYLHWEFHRDPTISCSTMNARPFILNNPNPVTGHGGSSPVP